MKSRLILIVFLMLVFSGCSQQKEESIEVVDENNTSNEAVEQKQEENRVEEEPKKEMTIDDYKKIVVECFDAYYQTTMDAEVMREEKSFYLWNPIYADGNGRYTTPATVLQFKENPNEIYNGTANKIIWKDGSSVQGQFEIGGGPMDLSIINGPINIRKDHNTESEKIRTVENGEHFMAFDNYDDGQYIWYRVYDSQKDVFGWIASDKNDPWVGIAI